MMLYNNSSNNNKSHGHDRLNSLPDSIKRQQEEDMKKFLEIQNKYEIQSQNMTDPQEIQFYKQQLHQLKAYICYDHQFLSQAVNSNPNSNPNINNNNNNINNHNNKTELQHLFQPTYQLCYNNNMYYPMTMDKVQIYQDFTFNTNNNNINYFYNNNNKSDSSSTSTSPLTVGFDHTSRNTTPSPTMTPFKNQINNFHPFVIQK